MDMLERMAAALRTWGSRPVRSDEMFAILACSVLMTVLLLVVALNWLAP